MANTYLTKTFSGSPTSNQKGTESYWFKRSKIGTAQQIGLKTAGSSGTAGGYFGTNDQFYFYWEHDGSAWDVLQTSRKFRDTSAWYHLLVNWDSTLNTSGDRIQIWVNGVRETAFADEVQPAQNETTNLGAAQAHYINTWGTADYFDGLMSHFYFIDGTAYPASTFGSTDATTGEWKINTSPTVTMGNNGFTILKDGNTITDQSSNSNDWTLGGGTLTKTEDCPSDVFCTLNPLANSQIAGGTFTTGNNTWQSGNSYYSYMPSTIGVTKGKYYWEVKVSAMTGAEDWHMIGISSSHPTASTQYLGNLQYDYSYYGINGNKFTNSTNTGFGNTYAVGDIISVALDVDNLKIYFAKNGTWQDSGDPTSGATGTGAAYTIENPTNTLQGCYFPSVCYYDNNTNGTYQTNFGNGYFGTTAISSEGTNASGIGKFEYNVPTGYTALSTKGLNE